MRLPCPLQGLGRLTPTPSASATLGQGGWESVAGTLSGVQPACLCSPGLSYGSRELGAGCDTVRVLALFCGSSQWGESRAVTQRDHGSCAVDVGRPGELIGGG